MQKRVTIKYCEYGEYGSGFLLANAPAEFTPGSGLTIAHDLLEHFPKDSGEVHEEAMAFGAILWIRGMNGFFTHNSPGYNMSVDIAQQFREFGDCIPFTKRVKLSEDVDSEIFEWIEEGIKLAWKEMKSIDEDMMDRKAEFDAWCVNWQKWCLYGYKKVQQRYKNIEGWNLCQVFQDIMKAVDNLRPEYDGQEFVVRYGTNRTTITEKESKMRNPFELYTGHPQVAEATREINKALKQAIKLIKKGTPHEKAMAVLDPVFTKYEAAGAGDSEPRDICWDKMEEACGEDENW